MMRRQFRNLGLTLFLVSTLVLSSAVQAFEPEQITVETLSPKDPYRLYLPDAALAHIADGKLTIIDGARMKVAGTVGTGMAGLITLSPDRSEIYVATNYYERISRGPRIDVLEIYDASTLKFKSEIVIPSKHAQALPYRGLIRTTSDGRYVLIQNATPASSVSIVDLEARKFLAEVPTPGCWAIAPASSVARRFSTLCGDGTLLTVSFDETGKATAQRRSEKFFDPDVDPVFAPAQNIGDEYVFVSFKGMVHVANVGGEVASFGAPWSMLTTAEDKKAAWRPGGYQFFAVHADSRRLYVGMHPKGSDGSHKAPAKEIWVFDLDKHARLARLPGSNALAVAVTQGASPKLFALDALTSGLVNISLNGKPAPAKRLNGIIEIPVAIEVQ